MSSRVSTCSASLCLCLSVSPRGANANGLHAVNGDLLAISGVEIIGWSSFFSRSDTGANKNGSHFTTRTNDWPACKLEVSHQIGSGRKKSRISLNPSKFCAHDICAAASPASSRHNLSLLFFDKYPFGYCLHRIVHQCGRCLSHFSSRH